MAEKNNGKTAIGLAVAGVALTAIGAAAGAVLANKELRGKLGKKTEDALKVVSKLATQVEQGAEAGLKNLEKNKEGNGKASSEKASSKKSKAGAKKSK